MLIIPTGARNVYFKIFRISIKDIQGKVQDERNKRERKAEQV